MSVARAQREIDSAEFSEWLAYDEMEPFGDRRADLRAGICAAATANASGHYKKALTPEDFMPKFGEQSKQRQTAEQHEAIMRMIVAQSFGKAP